MLGGWIDMAYKKQKNAPVFTEAAYEAEAT
jgi:hypothetical protein